MSEEEGRRDLRRHLEELVREEAPLLAESTSAAVVDAVVDDVVGLDPIEPLLADPEVSEVMVNGPAPVWGERAERLEAAGVALDAATIRWVIERAVTGAGLRCDRSSPVVDARLADGSRFHAVIPPLAVDGPYVTIRRFAARELSLVEFGVDRQLEALLESVVARGWNLVVTGGTSSGKTTFLNALSALVPAAERVVTIEDTAELRFRRPHVLRLEVRPPNAEGVGGVSMRELVRAALRMRPDRIVVGEVRGPEALDMLEALNTGHDGSLSTVHANGPLDGLLRLEHLALGAGRGLSVDALRAQLLASIDAVVHLRRVDGEGRAVEVLAEVDGEPAALSVRTLYERSRGTVAPPRRPFRRPSGGIGRGPGAG